MQESGLNELDICDNQLNTRFCMFKSPQLDIHAYPAITINLRCQAKSIYCRKRLLNKRKNNLLVSIGVHHLWIS